MSYLQRVFYVGESAEPIEPVGDMTAHWVVFSGGSGTVDNYPIETASLTNYAGTVKVAGIYSDSGGLYIPGETIEATGVARIWADTGDDLPLGALTAGSAGTEHVAYWRFNDATSLGTLAFDSSGNGHTASCVNALVRAEVKAGFGKGLDVAGTGAALTVAANVAFELTAFSVVFLYDSGGTVGGTTEVFRVGDGATYGYTIYSDGAIVTHHAGGSSTNPNGFVEWNGLVHIGVTYTGVDINSYKDGVLIDSIATTAPVYTGGANLVIGSATGDHFFDDLGVYNRAIGGVEMTALAAATAELEVGIGEFAFTTINPQTAFELPAAGTSFRGASQFRMNFRTADANYGGVLGDYAVGVPAPVEFPIVDATDEVAADAIAGDTRFYTMTYVNQNGYESAPGPVNPTAVHYGVDEVLETVTNIQIARPLFADVGYHAAVYGKNIIQDYVPVVAARIYRTNTGTTETGYQFVAEVGLGKTASMIDDVLNQDLGELLVTEGWDVPPPFVTAGCKMANGTYVLVHEYTVYMSVPGVIYAFPVLYNQVVRDRLIHIEAVGTVAIALSDGGPYLIAGGSPDVMEIVKLPFYQACLSVRAVSVYLDLVIYPAQDGLMGVSASGKVVNLTEGVYEEQQWRAAYALADLFSEVYDGVYYAFETATGNGFAFNIQKRTFQPLTSAMWGGVTGLTRPTGLQLDKVSDSFYMAGTSVIPDGGVLYEWEPATAGANTKWYWESKEFYIPDRSYGAMKLTGLLGLVTGVGGDALETVIVADAPINYWKLDENAGTTAVDTMTNSDQLTGGGFTFADVGVSVATTRNDGVGRAVKFASLGGSNLGTIGHAPTDPTDTLQDGDFTFSGAVVVDTSIAAGGFATAMLFVGSEGATFAFIYDISTDELLFKIKEEGAFNDPADDELLIAAFGATYGDVPLWLTIEGDVPNELVNVYVNDTFVKAIDLSLWLAGWSGTGSWRWSNVGHTGYDSSFALGVSQWAEPFPGTLDEWAYYNKLLTPTEKTEQYDAWLSAGVPSTTHGVQVTLNVDGVDQPLFPISSVTADGIVQSEDTFRLPAVRGSKLIVKMESMIGSPEVHTAQIAVHPTEII